MSKAAEQQSAGSSEESCDWLRALTAVIQFYDCEPDRPESVQTALDTTLVAACARIRRLVRSDRAKGSPK